MYVSMKEMLQKANRENYAVMAINCFNLETAKAVIEAAEEMRSPIIVDLLQDHLKEHLDIRYLPNRLFEWQIMPKSKWRLI